MSYEKQNFEDGAVLKAEHLNHIEDGIADHENRLVVVEAVASDAEAVIGNHESRIATLEEGGGSSGGGSSGGGKLYIHRVTVQFDDPATHEPSGTLSVSFFSREANKITSISTLSSTLGKYDKWGEYKVPILSFNESSFCLLDSPSGKRDVDSWYINYDGDIGVCYVSAYTVPRTISETFVRYNIINSVNDTVMEI